MVVVVVVASLVVLVVAVLGVVVATVVGATVVAAGTVVLAVVAAIDTFGAVLVLVREDGVEPQPVIPITATAAAANSRERAFIASPLASGAADLTPLVSLAQEAERSSRQMGCAGASPSRWHSQRAKSSMRCAPLPRRRAHATESSASGEESWSWVTSST